MRNAVTHRPLRRTVSAAFVLVASLLCAARASAAGPAPVFGPPIDSAAGAAPSAVVSGVFSSTSPIGLAVADADSGQVAALGGDGTGSFPSLVGYGVGSQPTALVAEDFTGDEILDLAVANGESDDVSLLVGNGDGTFHAGGGPFAAGQQPSGIASGDFNGDHEPDLAVANAGSGEVSVLLGDGAASFNPTAPAAAGAEPASIDAADFDGDGNLDLVVANAEPGGITVLLGRGDGSFVQPGLSYEADSHSSAVAAGDLNDDGKPDVAVANAGSDDLSILLNAGDGTFGLPTNVPSSTPVGAGASPQDVELGDLTGDGNVDVAVANEDSDDVSILTGDGTGTFTPTTSLFVGSSPEWLALDDFNGDEKLDVASANQGSNSVSALLNTTSFPAPVARTRRARAARTSATLAGDLRATAQRTSYYFEYGRTRRYGLRTARRVVSPDDDPRPVKARVTGLRRGTTYHYRLVASSRSGGSLGVDMVFRTRTRSELKPRLHFAVLL